MTFTIIRGNALALPLEDASVDLVVTSPPYFGLRSYQDGGEHYDGQLGSEATPAEFLDALLAATAEMVRVLKPSGSIFVNLGDKYAGGGGFAPNAPSNQRRAEAGAGVDGTFRFSPTTSARQPVNVKVNPGVPAKSLIGIPWRYALRCIDDLGLILRAEIIWSKPNGLPESVTDRVRRSHEQWFHFTVRPRYFSAVDEVREPHAPWTLKAYAYEANGYNRRTNGDRVDAGNPTAQMVANPLGKLPGSVWSVPTQPLVVPPELGVDHFAAFPMEWPRRLILGWSPSGVCTACGEGRRPVAEVEYAVHNHGIRSGGLLSGRHNQPTFGSGAKWSIAAYACACPDTTAPTTPATVLDPFGGTGTTALVAHALGRHGISVDLSADYCRLAEWRCNDRGQLAAAMQVDKPEPVPEGQLDMFGEAVSQ